MTKYLKKAIENSPKEIIDDPMANMNPSLLEELVFDDFVHCIN